VEFSYRDLKVPFVELVGGIPRNAEVGWKEYLPRTYLFWTPHPWLALRAEYLYEKLDREKRFSLDVPELRTHRVPLGINFFHPSGFGAFWTATYWNQNGKFELLTGAPRRSGSDDFVTVDAGLRYRLPQRYGFITIGATNLFDKKFKYFESDFNNPSIQPKRTVFGRVTLALP
jgi:outer membrane receptor protein involved in Fe transport